MIDDFIQKADAVGVWMIMVGGGAVNYHGYRRHSADVDFWIDTYADNLIRLIRYKNTDQILVRKPVMFNGKFTRVLPGRGKCVSREREKNC